MLEGDIEEGRKIKPQESEFIFELSSCQSESQVCGRSKEIVLEKDKVQSRTVAVVLIIGAPGFGKTTVTKMTAQKSKGTKTGKLLFCRLPRKETLTKLPLK